MGYFAGNVGRGAKCVFKGTCEHAPAVDTYHHEFTNYSPKPMCAEHKRRVESFQNHPRKRGKRV